VASTTMTYGILTSGKSTPGSVKWMVGHELIYAEQAIAEAEAWIYERLRVREMQEEAALTFSAATSTKALPTGFQQPIRLMIDGYGKLPYRREDDFPNITDSDGELPSGTPSCWTVLGSNIVFDTKLNEELTGRLWFYGTPAALATTNFLTDRFPTLFRHAILARAYAHRNRADMLATEELLAEKAISVANAINDDMRYGQEL